MNRRFNFFLFAFFCSTLVFAQTPKWIYHLPKSGNITYRYSIEHGIGASENDARNSAYLRILQNAANSIGVPFDSKKINDAISNSSSLEIISVQNNIPINKVCEYTEKVSGEYRVYLLCQVAKTGNVAPLFDEFRACDKIDNNTSALWRSAVIPGWGQFYKKKTSRGIALLASEALLISTTIYCEAMRSDNMRKSNETLNIAIVKEYRSRADTWEQRRNIAIGGAIAVYAINLLDAALGKGQPKYACIPGNLDLLAYKEGNINQFGLKYTF